ncbi:hypothetical protein F8154_13450 [Alkaliphilus pronyensis]|uniref:Uncharacterized protein n=1 Tax=Alkaliphilus pronyensis TaxID=1482732 RepID=A0A6I0F882_9FIRM|nr:hypothetical protein [Alkaliphilus pronyensis]KAB3530920.1 hypothetical protein F8154_13450 [Alkaliphilus pronyensis]
MKWKEVRELCPNQFVKFQVLKSHIEGDTEHVDEIALIGPVEEDNATRELLKSKENILVYHTSKMKSSLRLGQELV